MTRPAAGRRDAPIFAVSVLMALLAMLVIGCGGGSPASGPAAGSPAANAHPGLPPSVPTWIEIPSIHAMSSLVPLGLNPDNTVQVPPVSQPGQAGWYRYGPTPGQVGPAVVLGHIDGNHQPGVFWRLHELTSGSQVLVGRQDGRTLTFVVNRVTETPKARFPGAAVYGNTHDPELRLITCGGAFDAAHHSYLDNIIVYATLTGSPG